MDVSTSLCTRRCTSQPVVVVVVVVVVSFRFVSFFCFVLFCFAWFLYAPARRPLSLQRPTQSHLSCRVGIDSGRMWPVQMMSLMSLMPFLLSSSFFLFFSFFFFFLIFFLILILILISFYCALFKCHSWRTSFIRAHNYTQCNCRRSLSSPSGQEGIGFCDDDIGSAIDVAASSPDS